MASGGPSLTLSSGVTPRGTPSGPGVRRMRRSLYLVGRVRRRDERIDGDNEGDVKGEDDVNSNSNNDDW